MFKRTLREWRDRHFWILLFLSLIVLFCVYRITLPSPIFINLGTEGDERYLHSFYPREQGELYPFRWTKDSSYIKIPNLGSLSLEIVLGADAARPEGQPLPRVALIANGTVLADFTMQTGIWAHQFLYHPPPVPLPRDLLLEVKSDTFVPPRESRSLGIILNTVEVKPIISPLRLFQVSLLPSLMGALSIAFSYLLLRWLGVSQNTSLVCGIIVLALLGIGIVQQFIVARFLVGVFGLLLMSCAVAVLLEARGYREPLIARLGLGTKTTDIWAGNPVSVIWNSIKSQALSLDSQSSGILGVLPAYLPAVVLFVLMPFTLYLPNQETLDNNLALVIPYLVLAVVYFVSLIALAFFVGQPLRSIITILLFYIGLYLCLSDIMSPVQLEQLMDGRETPTEPFFLTAIEVALVVVVVFSAIKLPWKHVKRFGSVFVLLLLVSEVIPILNGLSPNTELPSIRSRKKTLSNPPEKLADGGNIYHITLDGYSGPLFLESLEEMKLADQFDGFTFFKDNRANYDWTLASVPSYMTGSFYKENHSLKEWRDQRHSSGLIKNLYDAGYEVSTYTDSRFVHEKASHAKGLEDVLMQYKSLSTYYHFADLWLLRVAPSYLQKEVYWEGKGIFTRLFVKEEALAGQNAKIFGSVELMRQLIDDEADRPDHGQYVYAHIFIPHGPYVMNRDCVFSPGDSHYDEQTLCATRLMAELVSELKEFGRYDKSTIIFQSDHGNWSKPCGENTSDCTTMSLEIEKEIEAVKLLKYPARAMDNLTRALLLIKPPSQSGKPLAISDHPTQLVDIPATLYDLLDLPVRVEEGESVFSPDLPETREIHMFFGLYVQVDKKSGTTYAWGTSLFEGEANHFSFTNGKGWKIYPNIHVRWE